MSETGVGAAECESIVVAAGKDSGTIRLKKSDSLYLDAGVDGAVGADGTDGAADSFNDGRGVLVSNGAGGGDGNLVGDVTRT